MENGAKFPIRVRDRLKIEQAAKDYHFGKIRERQAHFTRHTTPDDMPLSGAKGRYLKED